MLSAGPAGGRRLAPMSLTSSADDESYRDDEQEEEEDNGEDDTSNDPRCLCAIVLKISISKILTTTKNHSLLQHCKIDCRCVAQL